MLSGNKTSCLDRISPWKSGHEMTVASLQLCGFSSPCKDVPFAVIPGVHKAGEVGVRTTSNVAFNASKLNMKVRVLVALPDLGVWGVNPYPVTEADASLSLCRPLAGQAALQHQRLPWMGTRASHTAHPPKWRRGRGKVKGERRVRREGQERFTGKRCRACNRVIQTGMSRQSDWDMHMWCARYSSLPSRSGEVALINDVASVWERC